MEYHVALACSNLLPKYDIPAVISIVIASGGSLNDLKELKLPKKGRLLRKKERLNELRKAFRQAEPFLEDYDFQELEPSRRSAEEVGRAYVQLIDRLLENKLLRYIATIKVVSFRSGIVTPRFTYELLPQHVKIELSQRGEIIQPLDDRSSDPLLITAQNLATLRYQELKEVSVGFTVSRVLRDPASFSQLLQFAYPSPAADSYDSYLVGLPTFSMRDTSGDLDHQAVNVGNHLDLVPALRFCCGNEELGNGIPCVMKDATRPYGSPISLHSKEERCEDCKRGKRYLSCLTEKPACDGLRVVCGNEEFAANICIDSFGLYVTRFKNTVKVGKAFLPNLIGRLLYQGANSALIIYPIFGIERCWILESQLADFLSANISRMERFHVEKVRTRGPGLPDKLEDFCKDWDRDDTNLLTGIRELISSSEEMNRLSRADLRVVSFLKNYYKPTNFLLDRASRRGFLEVTPWVPISGKILGYRGTLIFLEGKGAIDAKKLQGFVLERSIA